LLTVIVTLQVPALLTVRATVVEVLGPGDPIEHPAVPGPDGRLHEKFSGASPVALPVNVMLLVWAPLMNVVGDTLARLARVKLILEGRNVKVALPGL
jgi:hypothetical protein